ncbi:cell division suppressor protein YneA [Helcococcus kunzii]|uniref:cell division suppressor protein YneA n=1 Tax=Helcococcus kunzii TaxID=40091 RepID=UPI0024AD9FCC|nr:LysM peptidoglycan-binding domain-containing protein [Helcococcus kunzii]
MKFRVKDQKKFNRFIILSALLVILFTLFFTTMGSHPFVEGKSEKKTITVDYGDTLWDIAKNVDSDRDLREIIYEIKELNNIDESDIFPGDQIKVPTY